MTRDDELVRTLLLNIERVHNGAQIWGSDVSPIGAKPTIIPNTSNPTSPPCLRDSNQGVSGKSGAVQSSLARTVWDSEFPEPLRAIPGDSCTSNVLDRGLSALSVHRPPARWPGMSGWRHAARDPVFAE